MSSSSARSHRIVGYRILPTSGARTIVMDVNAKRLAFVKDKMGVPDTILCAGDNSEIEKLKELTNYTGAGRRRRDRQQPIDG